MRVKKVQTVVGLEPERFAQLVTMAKAEGRSRNEMIRILVDEALAAHDERAPRGPLDALDGHIATVINLVPDVDRRLRELAEREDRPLGHMFRILLGEAIGARERIARRSA